MQEVGRYKPLALNWYISGNAFDLSLFMQDHCCRLFWWMYWMNSAGFLPDVCWEKMGEARNLRNPQWNTSSSLDLIGSVLLGCLRTKTCMTDIYAQKKKNMRSAKIILCSWCSFSYKKETFSDVNTFCSWGKRDTRTRGLPDWTLSITEKGTSMMCRLTYQPSWNVEDSRVSEAKNHG